MARTSVNRRTALGYLGMAGGSALALATADARAGADVAADGSRDAGSAHRASFVERKDGTALFYRDWGAGAPIVFVASSGLNSSMWAYQMVPLVRAGFRCVAFDRRGHGRSSDPGRGYDADTLSD